MFPPELRETVPARLACFLAHALAGNARDAHAAMTRAKLNAVATAADVFPRIVAQGYALAGMPERALHWLAIAVDRGFINYPFLAHHDPFSRGSSAMTRDFALSGLHIRIGGEVRALKCCNASPIEGEWRSLSVPSVWSLSLALQDPETPDRGAPPHFRRD